MIWNGEKCDRKWFSIIQNGPNWTSNMAAGRQVAYWSEMARNAIKSDIRSSKMAVGGHFEKKIKKRKVAILSEMASNAIKSDFWSSKMAASSHFVKKIKVAYWSEMARNASKSDFRWPFWKKKSKKRKVAILSEMASNAPKSDFWSSKMAASNHFVKKNKSCLLIWNGEKCD